MHYIRQAHYNALHKTLQAIHYMHYIRRTIIADRYVMRLKEHKLETWNMNKVVIQSPKLSSLYNKTMSSIESKCGWIPMIIGDKSDASVYQPDRTP